MPASRGLVKTKALCSINSAILLAVLPLHSGDAATTPSKISAFAGEYKGTINAGGPYTGRTTGRFKVSKRKEIGALKLESVFSGSVVVGTSSEEFSIRGKKLIYRLAAMSNGTSAAGGGVGRVRFFRRTIRCTSTGDYAGETFVQKCTIRKTRNGLEITNHLFGSAGLLILYKLKGK